MNLKIRIVTKIAAVGANLCESRALDIAQITRRARAGNDAEKRQCSLVDSTQRQDGIHTLAQHPEPLADERRDESQILTGPTDHKVYISTKTYDAFVTAQGEAYMKVCPPGKPQDRARERRHLL